METSGENYLIKNKEKFKKPEVKAFPLKVPMPLWEVWERHCRQKAEISLNRGIVELIKKEVGWDKD